MEQWTVWALCWPRDSPTKKNYGSGFTGFGKALFTTKWWQVKYRKPERKYVYNTLLKYSWYREQREITDQINEKKWISQFSDFIEKYFENQHFVISTQTNKQNRKHSTPQHTEQ